jgi:branched-chain amino acid transport system substrate-binding protein
MKPRRYGRALRAAYITAVLLGGTALSFVSAQAAGAQRGVTDTEIVIGSASDLSGVTAVQGVNNSDAIRMAFDDINAKGGIHGRKIRFVVEDMQYQVPRAVQAMNKLVNLDNIFLAIDNGGTPMNNANMPGMFEKGVPNMFPLTAARSMYEPFNKLKFGQFSSYYDEMRAGVKYFVEQKGKKNICAMYQDSDFGRDVLAGAVEQLKAMNMSLIASTAHKPTDTDFNASIAKLHDAGCDMIVLGTIVRDTTLIIETAHKIGWNVDMVGQFASYDTAIAEAPGNPAEGFYAMVPALYAYPDDPRPAVQAFGKEFKEKFGREPNFHGEVGYTAAQLVIMGLDRAGRDLTTDSFIKAMETIKDYHDIFGAPAMSFSDTNHHASSESFLAVVHNGRWTPVSMTPLGY